MCDAQGPLATVLVPGLTCSARLYAEQVPALKKLIETRNKLRDLMTKVDRSEALEGLLEQVLQNEEQLKKFSSDLGIDASKESK